MSSITLHDKSFRPFIPYERLEAAIDAVAEKINSDYEGCEDVPVLMCTLNGAIMFCAELMKRLRFKCQLSCIKLSSYQGTQSTGTVLTTLGPTCDVKGRRVIICEDIVDTGNTIIALQEMLQHQGAAQVRICTMLLKPEVYDKDVPLDYVAMEVPNAFIVGFGLDYNELGRNLKDIYVLE